MHCPGAEQAPLLGHRGRVTSVAFAAGRPPAAITAGEDGTTRTWSLRAEPELRRDRFRAERDPGASRCPARERSRTSAAPTERSTYATPDGRLIAERSSRRPGRPMSGSPRDGDTPPGDRRGRDRGHPGRFPAPRPRSRVSSTARRSRPARFSRTEALVSGGRDGNDPRMESPSPGVDASSRASPGPVLAIAASPDGRLVATAVGDIARVRALTGGKADDLRGAPGCR